MIALDEARISDPGADYFANSRPLPHLDPQRVPWPLRFCAMATIPYLVLDGASDDVFAAVVLASCADAWIGELHWRKEVELRPRYGNGALRHVREWLAANEQREREAVAAREDEWSQWWGWYGEWTDDDLVNGPPWRPFTAAWIATWWMAQQQGAARPVGRHCDAVRM